MHYRMEPVQTEGLPHWIIELEVGSGIAKKLAVICDLTTANVRPRGLMKEVSGHRTLTLDLDDEPTRDNCIDIANELALALLETGKAKPDHVVMYVFHDGLTHKTVDKQPEYQCKFHYVPVDTHNDSV